jgi:hypothetical protein
LGYGRWGYPRYSYRYRYPFYGAAAIGAGIIASSYYPYGYYGDSCLRWDGWSWVNVCYGYGYGGYGYPYW